MFPSEREKMSNFGWIIAVFVVLHALPARAQTYLYHAICNHSYLKQGDQQDDLTKQAGKLITCDELAISILDNAHVLLQFTSKGRDQMVLGLGGDGLNYDINPNSITLPLRRIYLPHSDDPGKPEIIDEIDGFCSLDAKADLRSLREADCLAKVELGRQRFVYNIESRITGAGQSVR
jgi:hypothetical protein